MPSAPVDERVVHHRHGVGDGPHDGVADEVGEADLALPAAAAVAVDDLAVDLEQLGRDVAEAGRRRHRRGCAPCWRRSPRRRRGSARPRRRRRALASPRVPAQRRRRPVGAAAAGGADAAPARRRGAWRGAGMCRLVVGEELLPRLADRARIGSELLVHLLDEPRVRAEGRPGRFDCSHRRLSVLVDVAFDRSRRRLRSTRCDRHGRVAFPKHRLIYSSMRLPDISLAVPVHRAVARRVCGSSDGDSGGSAPPLPAGASVITAIEGIAWDCQDVRRNVGRRQGDDRREERLQPAAQPAPHRLPTTSTSAVVAMRSTNGRRRRPTASRWPPARIR